MISLSVVIPALNEEANLPTTLNHVDTLLREEGLKDYELLVFDDGSTDSTGNIADRFSRENPRIRVCHNKVTQGMGHSFRKGIEIAEKEFLILVHGDNEMDYDAMRSTLRVAGKSDFIVNFIREDSRPLIRRVLSRLYTAIVNGLFGLKMKYYNGPSLFRTSALRDISIKTNGHAVMAETIVGLVKKNYDYVEIGYSTRKRLGGKTKAFRIKNVLSVLKALIRLKFYADPADSRGK